MSPDIRVNRKVSEYALAIITGGSSGIGNAIIKRMGKVSAGLEIINLSRCKPHTFFNGANHTHIECDLSLPESRKQIFKQLLETLSSRKSLGPILLVNNSGFGLYDEICSKPIHDHLELVEVNISALVELTITLLPLITKCGGDIMNIASTSAFQATPFLATYGASKAFVLNWTLALNEELRTSKANAIAVCPGPTKTNFFKRAGFTAHAVPKGYSMQADEVAQRSLLALAKSKPLVVTGCLNQLVANISTRLPKGIGTRLAGATIGKFRSPESLKQTH